MLKQLSFLRTSSAVIWVQIAVLVLAALAPAILISSRTDAYSGGYVTSRFITMETSEAGATDVIYDVNFTTATTHTIESVVLQYCDTSPILGDATCGDTRSFDWADATLSLNGLTGISASTINTTSSTSNKLIIDVDTPASVTAATAVDFQLGSNGATDGVTNPGTTNSSFYVRILTFETAADAVTYTAATGDGDVTDGGGVALSTAAVITVTAKVQETLTFCVWTDTNCATGGTAVAIGDATNGVIGTLDTPVNTDTHMDIATNATSGATVYMSGSLLLSGANDIDTIGATCTAEAAGTESFGLRVDDTGGTNFDADPTYACVANSYAFDTAEMVADAVTPYGDPIADTSAGPTDSETIIVEFDGNASNLTPAGIYSAAYDLVASATF